MNTTEQKLNALICDEASFGLIKLILDLMLKNTQKDHFIGYRQPGVLSDLESASYNKLKSLSSRFNGLCDLVSNAVIANDLMGHPDALFAAHLASSKKTLLEIKTFADSDMAFIYNVLLNHATNPYDKISLKYLDLFSNTHSLDVISSIDIIMAYFSDMYPFNLFSSEDKVQNGKQVDETVLGNKLQTLADGSYVKFMTFSKTWTGFHGHTMVIKKTGNTFSFFDPNHGEAFFLTLAELCKEINLQMQHYDQMAFLDGNQFIEYVKELIQQDTRPDKTATTINVNEPPSLIDELSYALGSSDNPSSDATGRRELNGQESLIIAKIKEIIARVQCSDDDLVQWGGEIKRIIHHNPPPAALKTLSFDSSQIKKRQDLDDIRFIIKRNFWGNFQLDCPDSVNLKKMHLPLQCINSPYDVAVLFQKLSIQHCQELCKYHAIKICRAINTPWDIRLLFNHLIDARSDIHKIDMIYNVIQFKIPDMIRSAHDIKTIFTALSLKQRLPFFNGKMLARLKNMIHSFNDLSCIFPYLANNKQRTRLFNQIDDRITEIIANSSLSTKGLQQALSGLLPNQRNILFDAMQNKLNSLRLENMYAYEETLKLLNKKHAQPFIKAMDNKLVDAAIATITSCFEFNKQLKKFPKAEDRARIFEATEKILLLYIDTQYDLICILECLTTEQVSRFTSHEKVKNILKKELFFLPKEIAESFAIALLSHDSKQIKTEFDRLTQNENRYYDSLFDYFKTKSTSPPKRPPLLKVIGITGILDDYWVKKITQSLQLIDFENNLDNTSIYNRLCEYCDNRPIQRTSFFEIKSMLNYFKSEDPEIKSKSISKKHH